MYSVDIPMSTDSLRTYGIAERVGVTSEVTGRHLSLVPPVSTTSLEWEYAVARPEFVEIAKPESVEIAVREFEVSRGLTLRRREPLVLWASLSVSDECYRADVPGLDIPISAYTPRDLIDALRDLIAALWKEYAMEDDANLTARGKRLKARLQREYTEIGKCS